MLALQSDMVVEYDMEACAAVGVVAFLKGATVRWAFCLIYDTSQRVALHGVCMLAFRCDMFVECDVEACVAVGVRPCTSSAHACGRLKPSTFALLHPE